MQLSQIEAFHSFALLRKRALARRPVLVCAAANRRSSQSAQSAARRIFPAATALQNLCTYFARALEKLTLRLFRAPQWWFNRPVAQNGDRV